MQQSQEYISGSEAVAAIAVQVINQSGNYDDFADRVRSPDASDQVRETVRKRQKNPSKFNRWLGHTFAEQQKFVRKNPAVHRGSHTDHDVMRAWEAALPLVGKDLGDGGRKVADLFLSLSVQHDRRLVGLSTREAVTQCNVSQPTASRAMNKMVAMGMLTPASGPGARRYRLEHPDRWRTRTGESVSLPSSLGVGRLTDSRRRADADGPMQMSDDIWTAPGLGERAWRLYMLLREASATGTTTNATEIATRMDISKAQVRKYFARLEQVGLARRPGPGIWEAEIRDTHDVAADLGVAGTLERRRAQSQREQRADRLRHIRSRMATVGVEAVPSWYELNVGRLEDELRAAASTPSTVIDGLSDRTVQHPSTLIGV